MADTSTWYDNPGDPNFPGNPDGTGTGGQNTGAPGGSDRSTRTGCEADGGVWSELDVNGNWVGNVAGTQGECVDPSEAERRRNITTNPPSGGNSNSGGGSKSAGGTMPAGSPNYGKAPVFTPLPFNWSEQFHAPTLEEAQNSPGYQFRLSQGIKALQQSAAAKGGLFTGGTGKALTDYGINMANQSYGDDFNRALQGYEARFGTAKDIYDRQEQGNKDAFAPTFSEWLQNAHGKDLGWAQQWANYWKNNLSAQDFAQIAFGGGA